MSDILALRFGTVLRACGLPRATSFDEAIAALETKLGKLPGQSREDRLHSAERIIAGRGIPRNPAKPKRAKVKTKAKRK